MTQPILKRVRKAGVSFLKLITVMLAVPSVFAQETLSTEQLQIFQSLTPEQQQTLLQQVTGSAGGSGSSADNTRRAVDSPTVGRQDRPDREMNAGKVGVLAPNDVVLVELAMPGTMARGSVRSANTQDPSVDTAPRRVRPTPASPPSGEDQLRWSNAIDQVKARNPYTLDREGYLNLPGFAPILIAGLSEELAVQRLSFEPALQGLDVSLVRLPVARTGVAGLKPFGYDLFRDAQFTLAPDTNSPVPSDYVMGPGDEVRIQLFGSQNRTLRLTVSREGTLSFPQLGPIPVSGLRFSAAKALVETRVSEQMIGVRADVSMGEMRTIQVIVSGEVQRQGTYTVTGLDTMITALFASGGVKPMGSLRNIQLKRRGNLVRRLDLYDLLIRGDTVNDPMLQPADVIFVPPVGDTVSIDGEVKRPAIYELQGNTTAEGLLQMAGGFSNEADPARVRIERVNDQYRRVVIDADFITPVGRSLPLRNGDALRVDRLRPQLDSGVVLEGFVHRPGSVAWRAGLRLTDVIGSIDELKANADARYVIIRREVGADRRIRALSADLVAALAQRGGVADPELNPRDRIIVFDLAPGRERIIKPLIDELRLQSSLESPPEVVEVLGRVKVPGEYPLETNMTVSDLLRAGGGLDAAAFGGKAELARDQVSADGVRQTHLIEINLNAVMRGDPEADVLLRPSDSLIVKATPEWTGRETVTLAGELLFPGTYPIRRGETLHEVIQRAGGLTSRAFARGGAFTREELRSREQKQLDLLVERMEHELVAMSVQAAAATMAGANQSQSAAQSLAAAQSLLAQLRQSRAVGRLVIDLPALLEGGKDSAKDVILRNGDLLFIPSRKQEVTVIGEVQTTTSHLYASGLRRDDYISLSGGTTRKADLGKIYVVRADGSVIARRAGLLRRNYDLAIQPGDTIVVPLDSERLPRLPFWQAVTQIIYNLAISVAAINSF